jgi:inner membrane protein
MDNLTHSLVGLVAAKAGLERLSPGATIVCVLAANAPDLDILATLGGRWFYLHNHRGITHSIVGTLALALLIPALFYLGDLILARLRKRQPSVRLRGLLSASLILSASHPLMDWTNNYGVRPLLPWSGRWFYGDLVFIVDPWIWLVVGGAVFLLTSRRLWQISLWTALALTLTGLVLFVPLERAGLLHPNIFRVLWIAAIFGLIIARRSPSVLRWGKSIALVSVAFIIVYWCGLAIIHRSALAHAQAKAEQLAMQNGEKLGVIAAMPVLADPFSWLCIADTDRATYRFYVSVTDNDEGLMKGADAYRFEKPLARETEAVARASQDGRAQIFLDFARFPAIRVEGDCLSVLLVQFADLRYTEPSTPSRGTFSLNVPVACDTETGNKK